MNLKLNNLTKSFADSEILRDFSYSFTDTGAYLIMGESGVGKTTLLKIIAGLDSDHGGSVENGGIKNTSFMFQEYRLFPALNAVKNAAIGHSASSCDDAAMLLVRLGFKQEDLKKKPRELSGGMKQRVAFVRAVLKQAPVLLLDEPTKELDTDTAGIMLQIINEEAKKRLVITVTHDDVAERINNAQIIRM